MRPFRLPSPFELSIACFAIGLLTFAWFRFRRRTGDHPTCPRCGYDVTGLAGITCPECGADLSRDVPLPPRSHRPTPLRVRIAIWLLLLPLPASVLTTAIWPFAPRTNDRCNTFKVASLATRTQVEFRCYTHDSRVSMLEVWFEDSDTPDADQRLTTILMANPDGAYWYRSQAIQPYFKPCSLDTEGVVECLQSVGDDRPDELVRADAEPLARLAATAYSTGTFPESVEGFTQAGTRLHYLFGTIPNWFGWAVGVFWAALAVGGLLVIRSHNRAK